MMSVKAIAVLALATIGISSGTKPKAAAHPSRSTAARYDAAALIKAASPLSPVSLMTAPRAGRSSAFLTVAERKAILKKAACTTYRCPAGYFWYYFNDPECYPHPDTFNAYIEYWNEDTSFDHDVLAGHATYWCGYNNKGSTVGSSDVYQNCTANSPWNCQDLGYTWNCHPNDGCWPYGRPSYALAAKPAVAEGAMPSDPGAARLLRQ